NAHDDELVWTCSVPSRATRAGHALRAISGPTAVGHASTSGASPPPAPNRPSSRATSSPTRFIARAVPHPGKPRAAAPGRPGAPRPSSTRSEEHTSELQSHLNLVCRLLLEKKKKKNYNSIKS